MMDKMQENTVEYGMMINLKKTKVMKISKRPGEDFAIFLEGEQFSQVTHFNYLGGLITQDGYCKKDIRLRIAWAKNAFSNREELLTKVFSLDLRERVIKTVIWSTLLYGAKSWSLHTTSLVSPVSCTPFPSFLLIFFFFYYPYINIILCNIDLSFIYSLCSTGPKS